MIIKNIFSRKLFFAIATIFAVFFFGLAGPQYASALAGENVEQMVAPYIQPIANYLLQVGIDLVKQGVYISAAGQLLQAAISNPQWIDVRVGSGVGYNPFVSTGLSFTMSIANILLIIVFLVIAMGFIFKIDKVDSAKALPKFLITALLINFGPLFVGMMVDIGNIFNASVIIGNPNVFASTCNSLMVDLFKSGATIIGLFMANSFFSLIPGISIAKTLALLFALPYIVFAQLPTYLLQIMLGEILTGLIFSNAIFFVSRIFVMQILTILSPIAILAGAIPQTEKWYRTWLDWLISWSLGGILVLFLLTLGFASTSMLMPANLQPLDPSTYGSYQFLLSQRNLYWFFLAIYMIVVDIISGMVVIKGVSEIESQLKGAFGGTKGMTKGFGEKASKLSSAKGIKTSGSRIDEYNARARK